MAGKTYLKDLKDNIERDIVRALSDLGVKAMEDAYAKKRFTRRTGNLEDSYGSAVFVRGKVVQSTMKFLGGNPISKKKDSKTHKTGRQTVKDYFLTWSWGKGQNEIVLVVIAAMYYAGILEKAHYFNVISPAREYIDLHWAEELKEVYAKHGIKDKPAARVIQGDRLR
jgi:hypothetical protein